MFLAWAGPMLLNAQSVWSMFNIQTQPCTAPIAHGSGWQLSAVAEALISRYFKVWLWNGPYVEQYCRGRSFMDIDFSLHHVKLWPHRDLRVMLYRAEILEADVVKGLATLPYVSLISIYRIMLCIKYLICEVVHCKNTKELVQTIRLNPILKNTYSLMFYINKM